MSQSEPRVTGGGIKKIPEKICKKKKTYQHTFKTQSYYDVRKNNSYQHTQYIVPLQ